MARHPKTIVRTEQWGRVYYDTLRHAFTYTEEVPRSCEPYAALPVVLNVVITRHCNMDCDYCVAKDFGDSEGDLALTSGMIRWINQSPFMLLVLTGGEPFLPPYDAVCMKIIDTVRGRGIVLDTNGTIVPSRSVLRRLRSKNVMVRVSMDSHISTNETAFRHVAKGSKSDDSSAFHRKLDNIDRFLEAGITTAVQTVVWRKEVNPLDGVIEWLSDHGVKKWYLQRLIPSHKLKHRSRRYVMKPKDYYAVATRVAAKARALGIDCVAKVDLRHNSVFLLTGDGAMYTQGDKPGQKILLGSIREEIHYFDYVSQADHACRYYLAEREPKSIVARERSPGCKLQERTN